MLKKFSILIAALFFTLPITSTASASSLAGSEWGVYAPVEQFIQFNNKGKLSGFAGCNSMFGSFTAKSDTLKLGPLATTRKACETSIMKAEFEFLKKLESVASYKRSLRHLELFNEAGDAVLKLKWRDFD